MNPTELLQQLRDIQTPPTPDRWPPAFGWWLLALLGLAALVWLGIQMWTAWRRWQRRQRQLRQLRQLFQACPAAQLSTELSILLRRLALTRFPREQVAGLHGEDWLRFLDKSSATDQFSQGAGRILLSAPYRQPTAANNERRQRLQRLAERWIKRNF